jgi:hypothetical protein
VRARRWWRAVAARRWGRNGPVHLFLFSKIFFTESHSDLSTHIHQEGTHDSRPRGLRRLESVESP